MQSNSVKKMRDEHSKKTLKKGLKTRLPAGVIIERGIPHIIKMGTVASDIKSWTVKKLTKLCEIFCKYLRIRLLV